MLAWLVWSMTVAAVAALFSLFVEGCTAQSKHDGADQPAPASVWTHVENDVTGLRLALAPDGSIYVAGYSGYTYEGGDFGTYESVWIGKLTAEGELSWSTEMPNNDLAPNDIAATSDSGFVLATEDFTVDAGADNAVTRYDGTGQELWTTPFDGRPAAVAVGPDDAIVVGGCQTATKDNYVALVAALASDGTPTWSATYGDPAARSTVVDIDISSNADVYLAGRMGVESASTRSRAWLHRADADGSPVWDLLLSDAIVTDQVHVVAVTPTGTAIALVRTDQTSVVAFDAEGTQMWSKTPSVANGRRLAADAQGGFVLVDGELIETEGEECDGVGVFIACPSQMRVARSDPGGALRWLEIDEGCDRGEDVAITGDDRVVVLAGCPAESAWEHRVATGLLLYADP